MKSRIQPFLVKIAEPEDFRAFHLQFVPRQNLFSRAVRIKRRILNLRFVLSRRIYSTYYNLRYITCLYDRFRDYSTQSAKKLPWEDLEASTRMSLYKLDVQKLRTFRDCLPIHRYRRSGLHERQIVFRERGMLFLPGGKVFPRLTKEFRRSCNPKKTLGLGSNRRPMGIIPQKATRLGFEPTNYGDNSPKRHSAWVRTDDLWV